MKISRGEQLAIIEVLAYGETHGYGNLITHLQTAWAKRLMRSGVSEHVARLSTARDGSGYPFQMQADLIERGEWDETGRRYRDAAGPSKKPDAVSSRRSQRPRTETPSRRGKQYLRRPK